MSSGGGSSGKIEFPGYIQDAHSDWLDDVGNDLLTTSMAALIEAAVGNSPFAAQTAYDPDTDIAAMVSEVGDFETVVNLLSSGTGLDDLIENILDDSRITAEVDAFTDLLDDQINSKSLPAFRAGMRDINAVMSSAFVLGEALITEGRNHEVARFTSNLRLNAFSNDALKVVGLKLEFQKSLAMLYADIYRMKIIAKKEENDLNNKLSEADARWDFDLFAYAGNLLAAPGGGTMIPNSTQPSQASSTLGGAISGASAGYDIAGGSSSSDSGYGAAIGGIIGGIAGYLS